VPVLVVVGAVLTDEDGRILAARRSRPAGWEFPGGEVEDGETEPAALARELREELGVTVEVGARVGPDVPMGDAVLRAYAARITAGTVTALEHPELRWLTPADLHTVNWLPADLPIATALTP
jgi:8-oxo-dGTP diphosphatase